MFNFNREDVAPNVSGSIFIITFSSLKLHHLNQ